LPSYQHIPELYAIEVCVKRGWGILVTFYERELVLSVCYREAEGWRLWRGYRGTATGGGGFCQSVGKCLYIKALNL